MAASWFDTWLGGLRAPRPADLALDPGTAWTRVVHRGTDVSAAMPSVVALAGKEHLVGADALRAEAGARRPLRAAEVEDDAGAIALWRHALRGAPRSPRVLVALPGGPRPIGRDRVERCLRAAGAGEVVVVPAAAAAALGAGVSPFRPEAMLVVSVGAGVAEATLLALGGAIARRTHARAGDALDQAIADAMRRRRHARIADAVATRVKHEIGAARPIGRPQIARVRGRDLTHGQPVLLDVTTDELAAAMADTVGAVRDAAVGVLRDAPPEAAADILRSGALLVGGGARLPELDVVLRDALGVPVVMPDPPEEAVIRGLARLLHDAEAWAALRALPG